MPVNYSGRSYWAPYAISCLCERKDKEAVSQAQAWGSRCCVPATHSSGKVLVKSGRLDEAEATIAKSKELAPADGTATMEIQGSLQSLQEALTKKKMEVCPRGHGPESRAESRAWASKYV